MASDTVSITFKMTEAGNGFKELKLKAEDLQKFFSSAAMEAEKLSHPVINAAAWATTLESVSSASRQLQTALKELTDAYIVQKQAETQLETVMRQRMNATDEQIQSIKDLCSAQQQLGVIGDEVQLAGAQQIATFLTQKRNLELLIPAMNNLLAQQKGLNATGQDAVTIGKKSAPASRRWARRRSDWVDLRVDYKMPWAIIARATFMKPATLAPLT